MKNPFRFGWLPLALLGACAGHLRWEEAAERSYEEARDLPDDAAVLARAGLYRLLAAHDPEGARTWLTAAQDRGAKVELALAHLALQIGDYELLVRALAPADPGRHTPDELEALVGTAGLIWGKDAAAGAVPEPVLAMLERAARPGAADLEPARTEARLQLAAAAWTRGDDPGFAAALLRAGVIARWRICAPCDAPDPAVEPAPGEVAARPLGANGRVRQGFLERAVATWELDSPDVSHPISGLGPEGGSALAEAWIALPPGAAPQELVLRLESSEPATLFVEGKPVLEVLTSGAPPLRERAVRLAVAAGPLRLTVHLVSSVDRARFKVVASHPGGQPVELAASPAERTVAPPPPERLALPEGYPARFRWLPSEPTPEQIIKAFHAFEAYVHPPLRDPAAAATVLHALSERMEGYPGLELARARLAAYDPDLPPRLATGRRRKGLERALDAWPEVPAALTELGQLELEEGRLEEAVTRFRRASMLAPRQPEAWAGLAQALERRTWAAELGEVAAQLQTLGAAGPLPLQAAVGAYRALRQHARALEVARRLEIEYPARGQVLMATLAADAGDAAGAAARLQAVWAKRPHDQDLLEGLIAAYRAAGDLTAAERVLDAVLADRPAYAWALAERVATALQRGDERAARDTLHKLSASHAGAAGPERLAEWLAGKPRATGPLPDTLAALPAWREAATRLGWDRFPAVTLSERTVRRVRADGGVLTLTHVVRLVQQKTRADEEGEIRLPEGADVLRLRTLRPDGTVLWPETVPGKADVSFSGLEPGDVIEWAWVVADRVRPEEGGYLAGIAFAEWDVPMLSQEATVLVEAPLELEHTTVHGAPAPETADLEGGWRSFVWRTRELPAIPREPHAIPARSFFPYVDLRIAGPGAEVAETAWQAIVNDYTRRMERLTRTGPEVLAAAREVGAQAVRGPRLVRALYEHVQRALKTGEPFNTFDSSAEHALASGRGNRTLVMLALARELGLEVETLLCTPERAGKPPDAAAPLPNANRFWYPILRFDEAPGVLLDPAEAYGTFGMAPATLAGATCLSLRSGARVVLAAAVSPHGWRFEVEIAGRPDARSSLIVSARGEGPETAALRRVYAGEGEAQRRQLWQRWLAGLVEGVELQADEAADPANTDQPFAFKVTAALDGLWVPDGQRLRLAAPLAPLLAGFFASIPELGDLLALPRRATPLRTPDHRERAVWTLQAPPGYRVRSRLEDRTLIQGPLRAGQTIVQFGAGLRVERWIEIDPGRVDPADYEPLRAGVSDLLTAFSEPIWLEPAP